MKKIVLILLASISLISFAQQSIVDVERSGPTTDSTMTISVEALGNVISGNNDLQLFSSQLGYGQHISENNILRVMGGGSYISSYGNILNNSWFGQMRHNFIVSENIKTFAFYQYQYNNVLLLDRRQLGGFGIRLHTASDSSKVYGAILVGAMYEEELLNRNTLMIDEKYHTQYIRGAFSGVLKINLSDNFSFFNTLYYQPHFGNLSDYRMLVDSDLAIGVGKGFTFIVSNEFRYDSEAPTSLKAYDFNTTVGFNYTFEK